mgnify:CR=1 FL=1
MNRFLVDAAHPETADCIRDQDTKFPTYLPNNILHEHRIIESPHGYVAFIGALEDRIQSTGRRTLGYLDQILKPYPRATDYRLGRDGDRRPLIVRAIIRNLLRTGAKRSRVTPNPDLGEIREFASRIKNKPSAE